MYNNFVLRRPKAKFHVSAGTAFTLQCPDFYVPCGSHKLSFRAKAYSYEFCTAEGGNVTSEFRRFGTGAEVEKDTKITMEVKLQPSLS